jgi:hypothetical protein
MNVDERNRLFLQRNIDRDDLWPKLKEYESRRFQFRWEFGLEELPQSPGLITIRGPRQSGKSTWLEMKLLDTLEKFGPGTAFFLNGDFLYSHQEFEAKLLELERSYHRKAAVKRLFIDEITQVRDWQRILKRLIDSGHLKDILIVTTGSNAADLLHGSERLPGRKGLLPRTDYLFLPIRQGPISPKRNPIKNQFEVTLPSALLNGPLRKRALSAVSDLQSPQGTLKIVYLESLVRVTSIDQTLQTAQETVWSV